MKFSSNTAFTVQIVPLITLSLYSWNKTYHVVNMRMSLYIVYIWVLLLSVDDGNTVLNYAIWLHVKCMYSAPWVAIKVRVHNVLFRLVCLYFIIVKISKYLIYVNCCGTKWCWTVIVIFRRVTMLQQNCRIFQRQCLRVLYKSKVKYYSCMYILNKQGPLS